MKRHDYVQQLTLNKGNVQKILNFRGIFPAKLIIMPLSLYLLSDESDEDADDGDANVNDAEDDDDGDNIVDKRTNKYPTYTACIIF